MKSFGETWGRDGLRDLFDLLRKIAQIRPSPISSKCTNRNPNTGRIFGLIAKLCCRLNLLASLVRYLCSQEADFMQGAILITIFRCAGNRQ